MIISATSRAPHNEHDLVRHSYNSGISTAPKLEAAKRDRGYDKTGCTVLHISMGAFYTPLEVTCNPGLKDKSVVIGTGPRAMVSAASYEAWKYGINSAISAARIHRLCSNGIFLPMDMIYYRMMPRRIIHEVFLIVTDRFEQVLVDKGCMDVSAALLKWGRPSAIGTWIHARVAERFHVTCSVSIACDKLVSKMTPTNARLDDMLLIPATHSAEFVQMMPLRGIPGIGPSLEKRLNTWGVRSVAESVQLDEAALTRVTGSPAVACGLWATSYGPDSHKIITVRREKSIGSEETLVGDTRNMRMVHRPLRSACDKVVSTLWHKGLVACTLTVELRSADLNYQTRSSAMERLTDTAGVLYPEYMRQLKVMPGLPVSAESAAPLPETIRLVGVSTSSLSKVTATVVQPSLDDMLEKADNARGQTSQARLHDTEVTLDAVRHEFGNKATQSGA